MRIYSNYSLFIYLFIYFQQKLENKDKFSCSEDDSPDVNDVNDGGDGATDDDATNDDAANNSVANDGTANDGAANDGVADDDILSSDSYNTEEDGRYVNSLIENYELHKK